MNIQNQRNALQPPALNGPGRLRPGEHLYRAAIVAARHDTTKQHASAALAAEKMYAADPVTPRLLLRGEALPATLANSEWAGAIAANVVGDFVESLAPASAGARLIGAGMRLSLDNLATISLPRRNGLPDGNDLWVAESAPIPAKRFVLTANTLGPTRKMASICVMSREVVSRSSGPAVIRQLLAEDMQASLDTSLFSTAAATDARPAGLLNGVTPLTAATGGGSTAMLSDLENLAGAIADNGGSGVIFIASPRQATATTLRINSNADIQVWPCRALVAGAVVAIAPEAFCSAFGPIPDITASRQTLVSINSTPTQVSTAGTPNTVGAPLMSSWQTSSVVLKIVLDCAWALRASNQVACVNNVTWGAQ